MEDRTDVMDDPFDDIEWENDDIQTASVNNTSQTRCSYRDDADDDDDDDDFEGTLSVPVSNTTIVFDPSKITGKRAMDAEHNSTEKVEQPKKKIRVKSVKFKEEDYEEALRRCEEDLSTRIQYTLQLLNWTNDESLSTAASTLLADTPLLTSLSTPEGRTMVNILHLRNAVRGQARILSARDMTEEEGRDGSTTEELLHHVLQHRRGSVTQWQQVFYALLRASHIRVRWITAIQSLSLHPQDYFDLLAKGAEDETHLQLLQQRGKGQQSMKEDADQRDILGKKRHGYLCSWLEIWLPGTEPIWIDIQEGVLSPTTGHPLLSSKRVSSSSFSVAPVFVLSVEDKRPVRTGFILRDYSDIYWSKIGALPTAALQSGRESQATKWLQESILRCRSWLKSFVEALSAPPSSRSGSSSSAAAATAAATVGSVNIGGGNKSKIVLESNKATLKIEKVGADDVIDLLDSDSDRDTDAAADSAAASGRNSLVPSVYLLDDDDDNDNNNNKSKVYIDNGEDGDDNSDEIEAQERLLQHFALQRQLQVQQQVLPTSLAQFRHHPYYCLARDLLTDECIHPDKQKKVVAVVRGESVYLRSAVEQLHTYDGWRRRLRRVLPEHRDQPFKVMQRKIPHFLRKSSDRSHSQQHASNAFVARANPFASASSSSTASAIQQQQQQPSAAMRVKDIKYYGSWQTEVMDIPPVDPCTSVIPRNEYGNLEIWDGQPQFVPAGAQYIPDLYADKAAKHLGVQYVPAVVGFETQSLATGGTTRRPKCQGIVVLSQDADLVSEVAAQLSLLAEEKEAQQRFSSIVKKWEKLVSVAMKRVALREKYGA